MGNLSSTIIRNASTLSPVGVVLYFIGIAGSGLPRPVAIGLSVCGLLVLLGSAYWGSHRQRIREYDERQLRIRYRAAYNAFLLITAMLFVIILGVGIVAGPIEESDTGAAAIVGVASLPFFGGLLAFQLFEGWYERTI